MSGTSVEEAKTQTYDSILALMQEAALSYASATS
jgi:hypothetical protein